MIQQQSKSISRRNNKGKEIGEENDEIYQFPNSKNNKKNLNTNQSGNVLKLNGPRRVNPIKKGS